MSGLLGTIERDAARKLAKLLGGRWEQVIDLLAEPVPPTPAATVDAPDDEAASRLQAIDHIVVVMLENRSFDHMLGYLSLPTELGGRGRGDVDGLRGPQQNFNMLGGERHAIHQLTAEKFKDETEDPDHSGESVDEQLAGGGSGFVENFSRISSARAAKLDEQAPDPGLVMGAGTLFEEGPSFLDDVANDRLPSVSWIDPHFKDGAVLGPNSNDDHPPSDLAAGQDLILRIFHALRTSAAWESTLLLITYDEHGGFYDHVAPPPAEDADPSFRRLGVRVPALLVSPFCAAGSTSTKLLGADFHFDHTSIIKTILTRFCAKDGKIPAMTARVQAANHLGHLLSATRREEPPAHDAVAQKMTAVRQPLLDARYGDPVAAGGPPARLTDFQAGFYGAAQLLRHAGLPAGRP